MKYDLVMLNMSGYFDFEAGVNNRNRRIFELCRKSENFSKILFVDFAPFTPKIAVKEYIKSGLYKSFFTRKIRKISDEHFVYSSVDPFLNMDRYVHDLQKTLKRLGFGKGRKLIMWSYDPLTIKPFLDIKADVKVFDTVDNWSEHQNFVLYKNKLKENYAKIDEFADVIFTVADDLRNIYKNSHKVHWVRNGVALDILDASQSYNKPEDLRAIQAPIIGYVGVIQDRIDFDLIAFLAEKYPLYSFVFVGPVWPTFLNKFRPKASELKRMEEFKNVYFVGAKPYDQFPNYVSQFDVSIIPHKINEFTKSMNPMKMYDYLAMGTPVVSTPVAGLERFTDVILTGSTYSEFGVQVEKAIRQNTPELRQKRVQSVQSESWDLRFREMIQYIQKVK